MDEGHHGDRRQSRLDPTVRFPVLRVSGAGRFAPVMRRAPLGQNRDIGEKSFQSDRQRVTEPYFVP